MAGLAKSSSVLLHTKRQTEITTQWYH